MTESASQSTEAPGTSTYSQMKATVRAHMQRDLDAGRKWDCLCEACREMRSLTGMDKLLRVWPLVREIQKVEDQLQGLPDGPDRVSLQQQYLALHDQLADAMAR